jgi:aldehyde:ferredoxin oxidoreductase
VISETFSSTLDKLGRHSKRLLLRAYGICLFEAYDIVISTTRWTELCIGYKYTAEHLHEQASTIWGGSVRLSPRSALHKAQ